MYKKKRKKIDKRKWLVIILLIICLILGFISNVVTTDRKLTVFEKAIKDSVFTVEKVIRFPVDYINKKIQEKNEKNKMYDEYTNLQEKIEELSHLEIENEELKKQLEEMKKLLDINNVLSDYIETNATVIQRDLGYFYDTIIIDKGQQDGITIDSPVVVGENLIGKVIKTSTFTSTIRLLTANNSNDKVSVKIKNGEDYIYGILNGYDSETKTYIIEGISENISIAEGSIVTTTGMGDVFPSGIVIGKVTGVDTDNFDLANILQMKSEVNFDEINYVTILKRNIIK